MLFYHETVDPDEINGPQLDLLLSLGWYRSGQFLFTTSHVKFDEVYQVHWLRFAVPAIQSHASHHRIRKKNSRFDFTIEEVTSIQREHQYLYNKYYASIDFEGAKSITDCLFGETGTTKNIFSTRCISVYDGHKLIAAGYFDMGETSVASILHFFDPDYKKYSLGKYLVLLTTDYMHQHHYINYYPGYVVRGYNKMDYKLFLGSETAEYFEPEVMDWRPFAPHLLVNTRTHKKSIAEQLQR